MDIYTALKKKHKDYKLNMPEEEARVFLALFESERWTWLGLAKLLAYRFSGRDMEDLIVLLQDEVRPPQAKVKKAAPAIKQEP